MQRDDGLNAVIPAKTNNAAIVLGFFLTERSFLRLNTRPLDGKPISVQTGFLQQEDILPVSMIMIHGGPRGFEIAAMGHLLLGPGIAQRVVTFNLVGCRCGSQEEFL